MRDSQFDIMEEKGGGASWITRTLYQGGAGVWSLCWGGELTTLRFFFCSDTFECPVVNMGVEPQV